MIARVGLLTMVLLAGPAWAQDKGRPSDRALAPLVACRPIADPRARASCYDAALDKLQQSVADRNVVVMDREQVKSDFGFGGAPALPKVAASRPTEQMQLQEIDSTVANTISYGYGMWGVRLANGALWRTTDALDFPPKNGVEVHIRRGALGSYVLIFGKNQTARVKRVR